MTFSSPVGLLGAGGIGWEMIFDGWGPLVRTLVLGSLSYAFLVALLRVSGKRTLSKMNAFELVITIAIGSTLTTVLLDRNVSLAQGVTALGALVGLQFINTFAAVRSRRFQRALKARPTLVFFHGEFLDDALRKSRLSRHEVLAAMRTHGFSNPEDVTAVVLETEGTLSVLEEGGAALDHVRRVH